MKKEVAGFVLSRIQIALINEAISLVGRGVVSPDDVDKVMRYGLGLRWAFLGPLAVMDLNGPTGFLSYIKHLRPTYKSVGNDLHVSESWTAEAVAEIEAARRAEVPKEQVPERQRWRDRRLMALLAHLRAAERDIGPFSNVTLRCPSGPHGPTSMTPLMNSLCGDRRRRRPRPPGC